MSYQDHVPAAERTLRILESVVASRSGLSAAQITDTLHIPRSAVYALLNTLIQLGYIKQDEPRQPYTPGPRLWTLTPPFPTGTNALVNAFRVETTRTAAEETYALAVLSSNDVIILAETPSVHTVRCVIPVGTRESADSHPAGLILRASSSHAIYSQIFDPIKDISKRSSPNPAHNSILTNNKSEVITMAAPICPDGYHPEAALIICCPAFRWSKKRERSLTSKLRACAARISNRLGARIYRPFEQYQRQPSGKSVPMSADDLTSFLNTPWAAQLACIRPDGTPHLVPVWYEWEDPTFVIVAWPKSVWASLVISNPTVALSIDEPWPPLRRVMVRGEAVRIPHNEIPGGINALRHRINQRYLGEEYTMTSELNTDTDVWSAFRITPHQTIALKQGQTED
jgi:DNA-binding IclR family transcriptional regulator/nitroimidazol reductase NimA-like FMN-containing flavoprotein (pyridoxamine 5'-phosphate oxidase superfamily)